MYLQEKDTRYWDLRLSWATAIYFICDAANATLKSVFNIPESLGGGVSALFGAVILLGFAMSFKEMVNRSLALFIRLFVIFLVLYLYSLVQCFLQGYPFGPTLKGTAFLTFAWWIPVGVYAASVKDKAVLYDVWIKASFIISFICILLFLFHRPDERQSTYQYNLAFGYKLILPLIFELNDFLRKKRTWLLLFILFQVAIIFLYSSRGPLLALFFFAIYKFAFESKSRIRKIVSIFFLFIVVLIMLSSMQTIAESAVAFLDLFGIESRTLNLIADGLANKTSGRDEIWAVCFKMIEEKPLLGWGLGAEYFKIGAGLADIPVSDITAESYNPHNAVIQNFVCFGVFGGLFANFIILFPLFFLNKRDRYLHDLLLVFASASVIPLMVSSAGFFVKPGVAIFLFLFYGRNLWVDKEDAVSPNKIDCQ